MSIVLKSHSARCLKNVCALALLAIAGSACSSDYSRLEAYDYASAIKPQQTAANVDPQTQNPYPDNVDRMTTASVATNSTYRRPPTPAGHVAPVQNQINTPQHARYQQQPAAQPRPVNNNYNTYNTYNTYQQPNKPAPLYKRPRAQNIDPVTTSSVSARKPTIQRSQLPEAKPIQVAKRAVTPAVEKTVAVAKKPVQTATQQATQQVGWTGTGGTRITVRDGETLHNISKRYGVPVSALMRVNSIANADHVKAGQQITVPTYIYSPKVAVSAPDNDSKTRASRATTGYIGEVHTSNIAVPTRKPSQYSNLKPGLAPMTPGVRTSLTPSGTHKVISGDSLGKIAANNNVSVASLMKANGLENSNIRIGQTLLLPVAGGQVLADAKPLDVKPGLAPISTDRVVTGSTRIEDGQPKPYVKPGLAPQKVANLNEEAPSRTGISTFRWPVIGKVISEFGDTRGTKRNDGIDISVPEGTSIKAAENGLVIYSGNELQEYGQLVLVRHEGGWVSAYAHNKSLLVKRGDKIKRGDIIAKSGRSGNAKLPMLHFELRKDSNPVDPQKHLR